MSIRRQFIRTAIAWAIFGAFLGLLNPGGLPVVVLIVPFSLLFVALYFLWELVRSIRVAYFGYDESVHRYLGVVVCGTVVLLLLLQSLGQLTARDVITMAAIIGLGYGYLGRTSLKLSRH